MTMFLSILIIIGTVLFGLLAGSAVDRGIVSFPARRRVGTIAWARYSRAADLGNGLYLYPFLAIAGALALIAALLVAVASHGPARLLVPLAGALVAGLANLAVTIAAAPKMLKIGKTDDREELLAPLVEGFVKLSYVRVVLISLAFAMALWALVVGSRLGG
jgi:hypothetical protein